MTEPAPEIKPPTLTKAPPTGRKFPCEQCGARLDFDPSSRGLKCPYCGHEQTVAPPEQTHQREIREHDLDDALAKQAERKTVTPSERWSQVRCTGCGAVVVVHDQKAVEQCPYCATHLENKPESVAALIPPESLLPFKVPLREARERFNTWLHGLWFAPTELKKIANLGRLVGVYVPFWTYDAMTYTAYTGQRGDDYWVTEHYTEGGQSKTRQVRHTRWTSVSGEVQHFFDDVLICGSKSLPDHLVAKLDPWDLPQLVPFGDEYLSGFQAERYAIDLAEGFHRAQRIMEDHIDFLCRADIGGDHQRIHSKDVQYLGVTFKHLLLPTWAASYRYHEKVFQVLVNGQSGEVAGDRPWSWFKILRLVFLILLAVVLVVLLVNSFQGR